jgi:hypothetical protein
MIDAIINRTIEPDHVQIREQARHEPCVTLQLAALLHLVAQPPPRANTAITRTIGAFLSGLQRAA